MDMRICVSNKFLGEADMLASLGPHFDNLVWVTSEEADEIPRVSTGSWQMFMSAMELKHSGWF